MRITQRMGPCISPPELRVPSGWGGEPHLSPRIAGTLWVWGAAFPHQGANFDKLPRSYYGWQDRQFGVPWWPETALLGADVAVGGTTLAVDTTDRPSFTVGGLVMVWSDFATWEAFYVQAMGGGLLSIGSQATKAWKVGARVVPLRIGMMGEQGLDRPANWLSSSTFSFSCEAV